MGEQTNEEEDCREPDIHQDESECEGQPAGPPGRPRLARQVLYAGAEECDEWVVSVVIP